MPLRCSGSGLMSAALFAAAILTTGCVSRKPAMTEFAPLTPPQESIQPATPVIPAPAPPKIGQKLERSGDEICVCGQFYHTGTPVVLWTDPGGYDAYRVEKRFGPYADASWDATQKKTPEMHNPARYGLRADGLSPEQLEQVRGGGWDIDLLRNIVDQFVIHYDVSGTSRQCFKVLQDYRGLSVHFMLDLDGTIYQCLDLKERAWHATTSNTRSVGVEIANIGAYAENEKDLFSRWYKQDPDGKTRIVLPQDLGDGGIRTPNFIARPARNELVKGEIQGRERRQYDFTPQQYEALTKLTATLCTLFPKLKCDCPRDDTGKPVTHKLPDAELKQYQGLIGHYHIQADKSDPGPAFQWDQVVNGARQLLGK